VSCYRKHKRHYHIEVYDCDGEMYDNLSWNLVCGPLIFLPVLAPVCTGIVTSGVVAVRVMCERRVYGKYKVRTKECDDKIVICCWVHGLCIGA